MKRTVKLISLVGCIFLLIIPTVLLIIPFCLDVQKYRPHIERKLRDAVGHPLEVGDQLQMSLFPTTRFWFSDLHLANPSGFTEKDFIAVKTFEARFKLLPFFLSGFKNIQIVHFFMKTPQIMMVKNADGRLNWEGLGNPLGNISKIMPGNSKRLSKDTAADGSTHVVQAVNRFSITGGTFLWIDHQKKTRFSISHLALDLANLRLDRPVRIALSAKIYGRPLRLKGKLGPLGTLQDPGVIPVDLTVRALKQLKLKVKGHLNKPVEKFGFDLFVKFSEFSAPELVSATGRPAPITFSDKTALNKVAFKARAKGGFQSLEISDGVLDIDESKIKLSIKLKNYSKPNITFDCSLDQADLNRYRPAKLSPKPGIHPTGQKASPIKRNYYNPLQQLVLKGILFAGKVKVKNTVAQNIKATLVAKNGILHFAPVSLELYGGKLAASASVNLRKKSPESHLRMHARGIQLGPLLEDIWQKNFLEGTASSQFTLRMAGHNSIQIRKSLSGKGEIRIDNGAIMGVDLLAMSSRNVGSTGNSKPAGENPKTPFSKLLVPFTISRGIVYSNKVALASSQVGMDAAGKADMVKERLDIRIEPISGTPRKEKNNGSELWVPVHISGSFNSPEFKPVLQRAADTHLEEASK